MEPTMIVYKPPVSSSAARDLLRGPWSYDYTLSPNDDTFTVTTTNSLLGNFVYAGDGKDTINGSAGYDEIHGGNQDDKLYGNGWNDLLYGEDGDDTLDGGTGADRMEGGVGADTYYVDDAGDVVIEIASIPGEIDVVHSTVSYTMPVDVEALILEGTMAIDGTGNAQDNSIAGNDQNNVLDGGGGADNLTGNGGEDTLRGGAGMDNLYGGDNDDKLFGGTERDTLRGGTGADKFIFTSVAECGLTQTDADRLVDFSSAQGDKIDLSAIDADVNTPGDQAFNFIGNNNAFVPAFGAGQLAFNGAFVEGDINGDLVVDFRIAVNAASLAAGDFIL
jgi:Ca2+-binding RTX toxin-like protein